LNRKNKRVLSATLAGIMATGVTGIVADIGYAEVVQSEQDAESASSDKSGDTTAKEAPENVYQVIVDGISDQDDLNKVKEHVSRTAVGKEFKADDVQSDLDDIQDSGLVKDASARTIQSNGKLYVVFNVTPLDETTKGDPALKKQIPKDAAGQVFHTSASKAKTDAEAKDKTVKEEAVRKDSSKDKVIDETANEAKKEVKEESSEDSSKKNKKEKTKDISEKEKTTEKSSLKDIKEAPKMPVIEDIEYNGNTKTKDWVLDKIVSKFVKKGDPINTDKLQSLYNELYNTRFFKDLDVRLRPGATNTSGIVSIDMKDEKTGEWNLGAGASTQDKLQAIGSIKDYNLGGTAQSIGLDFGIGTSKSNGEIYYTNPYLGKSDTSLSVRAFMDQKDEEWMNRDYTEDRKGASITLTKPISSDQSTKLYGGLSFSKISTDENWIENLTSNTAFLGVSQLHVDDSINAHKGYGWDLGVTSSIKSLGSDYNFTKYHASIKAFTPTSKKGVLAGRLSYDYSSNDLPFLEQFTVGGTDSIRGLDEDEQRGNKALLGTVEYRHSLNDWLQGVAFVDFGRAWDDNDTNSTNSFKVSPGIGLRAVTKMGILRFDAAKTSGHGTKFVFGIGQSF